MTYLQANPPRVTQFRLRRKTPSGVVVVHTAENTPDWVGPDAGAENVAAFIAGRTDYGSYHDLVDSDSIVDLVPYHMAAYHDGTGSNDHSYGVSAATQAAKWKQASPGWRRATVSNMARAAARYARWVRRKHGVVIPATRITKAESDAGVAGFISHGDRDPGRRSDPGADFDWAFFLAEYSRFMRRRTPLWNRLWEVSNRIATNTKQKPAARKAARRVRRIAARKSSEH